MLPSNSERLTAHFYEWEQRGRGWLFHNLLPVELEPPFVPFFLEKTSGSSDGTDDGRVPNIIGSLFSWTKRRKQAEAIESTETNPIIPYFRAAETERLCILCLSLPKATKVAVEETHQLLLMVSYCQHPISFEMVATSLVTRIQIACRQTDSAQIHNQVKAFFPSCIIKEQEDLLEEIIGTGKAASIVHFGLRDEFMRPVAMAKSMDPDPLTGLFAAMERLEVGESVVIQTLFQGTVSPWSESVMRSVIDSKGQAFFDNAPEMLPLAKEKVASPLFAVTMRIMGVASTVDNAYRLSDMAGSAFGRIYFSNSNSLIRINPDIDFETNVDDFLLRNSHLLGMLLNTAELATMVHLPDQSVTSARLERDTRKTKKAHAVTQGHALVIGQNEHQGISKTVSVAPQQRLKHFHVIGATGTGKSTFLQNLIVQDIQHGEGSCVLDPHGDLIESLLSHIPESRINDVLLIDPADAEYPVGFNILSAHSEIEKDILSSDLVAVFKRLSTSWGDQMNSVFANAILAILENSNGGTLVDLRRFLLEKQFREQYLKNVADPNVVYYWQKEFPLLKSGSIGPILTRLDAFLRPKLIRNMVAQRRGLDFEHILDSKKILLVKLSQGLIGNENSYLLGSFFITKIYQAAMARQMKTRDKRSDFFLYIDEFQNFITPSLSQILSGARKYHLGLILAHQDMQQLVKYDSELASSVVSNAGTRVCFRLGDADAKRFASGFSFFETGDLENLSTGQAICRIERPDYDFSLDVIPLPAIEPKVSEPLKDAIILRSRSAYGTPREQIEATLNNIIVDTPPHPVSKDVAEERNPVPAPTYPVSIPPISDEKIVETKEAFRKQKEVTQHRYLQNLIKKMAESRGYKAVIEHPTPDGLGRVDVHLERNGRLIACEVCVTTEIDWEVHNIQKCLNAGYQIVAEICTEQKTIEAITRKVEKTFDESSRQKILIGDQRSLFQYIDEENAKEASTEVRIKGYRVKVEYGSNTTDTEQKRAGIGKTVAYALRKKKNE